MAKMSRVRNVLMAGGLVAFAGFFAFSPLLIKKHHTKNLTTSATPLGGNAIMRGAYINTGSRDVGPDPDWDWKNGMYHGKSDRNFNPSDDDVRVQREAFERKKEAAAAAR
jgi:hypothetical protein